MCLVLFIRIYYIFTHQIRTSILCDTGNIFIYNYTYNGLKSYELNTLGHIQRAMSNEISFSKTGPIEMGNLRSLLSVLVQRVFEFVVRFSAEFFLFLEKYASISFRVVLYKFRNIARGSLLFHYGIIKIKSSRL